MMNSDTSNLPSGRLGWTGFACLAALVMMGAAASVAGDDPKAASPLGVIIEPPSPVPPASPDEDEADGDQGDPRGAGCPANQRPLELLVSLKRGRMG